MTERELRRVLSRTLSAAVGIGLLLWFLFSAAPVVLLFLFAVILAMALEPPVQYLSARMPRWAAALLVLSTIAALAALLLWLLVPVLVEQAGRLGQQIPEYAASLSERLQSWADRQDLVPNDLTLGEREIRALAPSFGSLVSRVGRITLSAVTGIVLLIILVSSVVYMLISPKPLLCGYLSLFPEELQTKAAEAFTLASNAVSGWMWSNVIVGAIEGVAAGLFLWWLGVPAPLLWGTLAFTSELVPKIGPYLMTLPPVLVAFSVDPIKALWVVLFFVALNEVTGDTVAPMIRGKTMNLHPVSLLFAVLALAMVFGFWGAILATPLTGIIAAYWEVFFLRDRHSGKQVAELVEKML